MSTAEPAIAAATVVLLRDAPGGWELLLLERHAATAFAGGAMVFPGGRVDPGDAAVAADPTLAERFAELDAVDAAARVAAAREAFEEAGVVLGHRSVGDAALPAPTAARPNDRATAADLAAWRARLNARTATWAEVLRATGTRLDAALLLPFAHWVPPIAAPIARRFDTLFYLARLPAGADASPDGGEAVTAHWTTPAAACARADAGEIGLVFPTRRNLERLAQYPTLDALWAATAARAVTRIQPAIVDREGTPWITIPDDCDYPVTAEPLASLRRE